MTDTASETPHEPIAQADAAGGGFKGNVKDPSPFADLDGPKEPEKRGSVFDDLDALKLDLDDDDDVAEEVLTTVPLRRPGKIWFRTYPSDEYMFNAYILEDKETKDAYYVIPALSKFMSEDGEAKKVTLTLCINRRKVLFFWPIPTKGDWRSSALTAVNAGRTGWVKAIADMALGGYRLKRAKIDYGDPVWPERSLNELLAIAFRGRVIDSLEHPLAKDV